MQDEFRYKAFISYSHADERWAKWLHKALESYRPPKRLIGHTTEQGTIPTRLTPIFRDQDELASATDLGEVIRAALAASELQIVVCSPAAASSKWVNEEILAFKRLGREDRVFCLIVDGEPNASYIQGREAEECFPRALRYRLEPDGSLSDERTEPLAADVRPGKDNKNDVRLKLIAGMLGVGYDELHRRELHRQQRRLFAIASAAVVGMVVTTVLATTALLARDEAEKQRERAEQEAETARQTTDFLVDLFNVSDPSEARGNSITAREILEKGAKRIEAELSKQPLVQARLMGTIGAVYTSLGLYHDADILLTGALQRRRTLLVDSDGGLGESLLDLGDLRMSQAEYEAAEAMYLEALTLVASHPETDEAKIARIWMRLAEVLTLQGRFEDAEPLLRQSLDVRRRSYGSTHMQTASSLGKVGLNLFDQGRLADAEPLLRDAIATRRKVLGDSVHPALSNALNNLAYVLHARGQYEEATQLFEESLKMNRVLLGDVHPDIAVGLNNLAFILFEQGDLNAAKVTFKQAITMHVELEGREHPEVANAQLNLAMVLYASGEIASAFKSAEESLALYRRLFPDGHPDLARALTNLGGWLAEQEDFSKAESLLVEGLDMRRRLLKPGHPSIAYGLTPLAGVYLTQERYEEARDMAMEARAMFAESLTSSHWRTAWAASIEGAARAGLREFDVAEILLTESLQTLEEAHDARPSAVASARGYVVSLYEAWDRERRKDESGADHQP